MATSDFVNGTNTQTFLSGVSKYVNDVYFNLSGDTMKANLTMNKLYTYDTSIGIGAGGADAKYIVFNTPSTSSDGQKIHNCSIMTNGTSGTKGMALYDALNEIYPFYFNVSSNRVYTQCPWRQDFITVLGASETENTNLTSTSGVVLPMTRSVNDVTDLNMLSIASNGVKINRSCLVEVSARVYFSNLEQGHHANIWIKETAGNYTVVSSSVQGQGINTSVSISPISVWLEANAVLQLCAQNTSGTTAAVNQSHTYMTVRVIGGAQN